MGRILIVEDSLTQAVQLQVILEECGFEVECARDANAGFEALQASRFDMVISDIMMPGPSGYDLCRRIKADPGRRDVPVLLLSSLNDPMDIVRGLECGADNFLTKPYEAEHLLARVRAVLDSRRLRADCKFRMGIEVVFLGTTLTITSEKEQILDLLMSTFEDIVRTNRRLEDSKAELAATKAELERYAQELESQVRRRTEALRERKDQLSRAQAIGQIGDWTLETDTGRITWSEEMYRIFGRSGDEFSPLLDDVMAMIVSEDHDRVRQALDRAAREKTASRFEFRVQRSDGEQRFCWGEAICKLDESGNATKLFGVVQDISEQKRAEVAARQSSDRYRRLVEHSPDGIFLMRDGKFVFANAAAGKLTGVSDPEDLIGREVLDFVHPDCHGLVGDQVARLAEGVGYNPPTELQLLRPDGSSVEVEASSSAVEHAGGLAAQVTVRDITERKSMQRQLHQAQKMEAIGQLTGGLAHDFNNLLAIVIGNLDLLQPELGDRPDDQKLVDAALSASLRGADLTHQLLAFARRQQLQPASFDLNALVSETTALLQRTLGEQIEIELRPSDELWLATADHSQVGSALLNLAINARDAMPEGGVLRIETENAHLDDQYAAEHSEVQAGDYICLTVTDTGTGIPPEAMSRVFEPFFTTKETGKGSGLGLSMIYGFAKQSGGHLKIYSELGHGTTVRLYLPRSAEQKGELAHAAAVEEKNKIAGKVILVVEDNMAVRDTVVNQLTRLGCRVLEANGPGAALQVIEDGAQLDLVFTDVVMPGLTGPELACEIRKLRPELKVLLTSGFSEAAVPQTAQSVRLPLLSKPYLSRDLARKIDEVLSGGWR